MFFNVLFDDLCSDTGLLEVYKYLSIWQHRNRFYGKIREHHYRQIIDHHIWLDRYHEHTFYQLFRMQRDTFKKLLQAVLRNDKASLMKKIYRGGNYPTQPDKSLLVFLWYMSKQDTLHSIADRFSIVPSTVMKIVNAFLYIIVGLKNKYIFWPQTEEEIQHIINGFPNYPGVIGAIDGTHIKLKVPELQHDSYVDRYQSHSINLMAVCTANKIFTYTFIVFPGCAHDARVFSHSLLYRNIEKYGKRKYFPNDNCCIIGDSAFPLRTWLMTPFKGRNINRMQKHHNYCLSSSRVNIENAFAFLKGRWARLKYINTYSISKAIEICTAACVLHNFCLLNRDEWELESTEINDQDECIILYEENDKIAFKMGELRRNEIARSLYSNIPSN